MANRIPSGRVGGHGPGSVDTAASRPARADRPATLEETGRREATGDTVKITDTASQLRRLEERLRAQPDVDAGRVEALRQRIAAGEYRVDPDRVADRLLRLERALG